MVGTIFKVLIIALYVAGTSGFAIDTFEFPNNPGESIEVIPGFETDPEFKIIVGETTRQTMARNIVGVPGGTRVISGIVHSAQSVRDVTKVSVGPSTPTGDDKYLIISNTAGIASTVDVFYDGDLDLALNPIGLGGVDFTEGGDHDSIIIELLGTDLLAEIEIFIYTDATHSSHRVFQFSDLIFLGDRQYAILYSSFEILGADGPADFANVGAAQIRFLPVQNIDITFIAIRTGQLCDPACVNSGECIGVGVCSCENSPTCSAPRSLIPETCDCVCPSQCPDNKDQEEDCTCECKEQCEEPKSVQNPSTCECSCPACDEPFTAQNSDTCECSCPACDEPFTAQNSSTCECSCPACDDPFTVQNPDTCECSCPACDEPFTAQNSSTCECSCPACNEPFTAQNSSTCECSCPTCEPPFTVQDPNTCVCSCNSSLCEDGETQDPLTCACSCLNECADTEVQLNNCSCVCKDECPSPKNQRDPPDCGCFCDPCELPFSVLNDSTCACSCPACESPFTIQDRNTCVCSCDPDLCPSGVGQLADCSCEINCNPPCIHGGECVGIDICNCTGTGHVGPTCNELPCNVDCPRDEECVIVDICGCTGAPTPFGGKWTGWERGCAVDKTPFWTAYFADEIFEETLLIRNDPEGEISSFIGKLTWCDWDTEDGYARVDLTTTRQGAGATVRRGLAKYVRKGRIAKIILALSKDVLVEGKDISPDYMRPPRDFETSDALYVIELRKA